MNPQEMLDLPDGAQVKLLHITNCEVETYILSRIPIGTILTRQHSPVDDTELAAFAHPSLEDGFDFFYASELEPV